MRRRSQLYVPANNPRMIEKAASLPADSVVIDLEDAVPPEQKEDARATFLAAVGAVDWGTRELCVRMNALGTPEAARDLEAIRAVERVQTILVPKADTNLSRLGRSTGKGLLPLIESPQGLTWIEDVVRSEGIVAVSYGAGDLATFMGGDIAAYARNPYVKTRIVTVAAAYGVDALDRVFFDLNDSEGFRTEALESRDLGYVGKQVVHPTQVDLANEVFSPAPEDVAWAQEVVQAYESAASQGRGALRVRGRLVDAVHYRWAKKVLERAGP